MGMNEYMRALSKYIRENEDIRVDHRHMEDEGSYDGDGYGMSLDVCKGNEINNTYHVFTQEEYYDLQSERIDSYLENELYSELPDGFEDCFDMEKAASKIQNDPDSYGIDMPTVLQWLTVDGDEFVICE